MCIPKRKKMKMGMRRVREAYPQVRNMGFGIYRGGGEGVWL